MSYNRIARYAPFRRKQSAFLPRRGADKHDRHHDERRERADPRRTQRPVFYKPEADKFARIPILTEKRKENPINLTKLCLVPDWGILVGTDRAGLKFY